MDFKEGYIRHIVEITSATHCAFCSNSGSVWFLLNMSSKADNEYRGSLFVPIIIDVSLVNVSYLFMCVDNFSRLPSECVCMCS